MFSTKIISPSPLRPLFEPSGGLRKFVRIAVNGTLLVPIEGLDDPITAGTQLAIIQAIAGA